MRTFAAMLVPYFKSSECCDYGNNFIDLPFQSGNVIAFRLLLLVVPLCTLLVSSVLVVIVFNCYRKSVF